jgi:alkylation response protein AidB-like acyl-CoA dehydrogenase
MKRTIYDEDHEAFRASVKEFLDRQVVPDLERHAAEKAIPREFWIEAGKQGFLGLEVPETYGGSEAGDYRFNAVLTGSWPRSTWRCPRAWASTPTSWRRTSST